MKQLHIISFDVPYPANYGGVIDVFYKLKQLHKQGVRIILHCYEYGRGEQAELLKYCAEVNYYKRSTSLLLQFSGTPFIVKSRMSERLMKRLMQDDFPILFEGLHTCGILNDKRLSGRFKIYRESNIEHEYYRHLANAEKNILKRTYFRAEANKLQRFEEILKHADKMLVVSKEDTNYLQGRFPDKDIEYLPSFHPYEEVVSKSGKGKFILYHGNLSIAENILGAEFLIREVFSKVDFPAKIAGLNPSPALKKLITAYGHIELVENPSDTILQQLISDAHINCLYTHQATGLKLKLLNSLFAGRHCLVNDKMLHGTGVEAACTVANSGPQFIYAIQKLIQQEFTDAERKKRKSLLGSFDVARNAKRIGNLL